MFLTCKKYLGLLIHIKSMQHIIKLADAPCFATVNLYFLRKLKALNFSLLLLHYYVNSGRLLNYVYIDICPRRRLHRMYA